MLSASRIVVALLSIATLTAAAPTDVTERDLELETRASKAKVYTKCSKKNTFALAFADGPYQWTNQIIDTLDQAGAKGTFYVNGAYIGCIYDPGSVQNVKKAYSHGHQIVSHTYGHTDLKGKTASLIDDELHRLDDALLKILGVKTALVAPPFRSYDNTVLERIKKNGQDAVTWDFGNESFFESTSDYDDLLKKKPKNVLALMDEASFDSINNVLPYVLKTFGAKGYKFVTVSECLGGVKDYIKKQSPGSPDSTWHC
ncbi:Carbohydrate esterase 4 protein [Tulasnella sp. 403]|nr:Carbohydrate esterase 4 protein [Tulasnella sp. 403]